MIPERTLTSKSAKSVFFEEVNDIDIYIEDTAHGYEKLFTVLFSRVFSGKYRVSKVFPLGGRDSVKEAHRAFKKNGRPSLFVVDGDLYLLAGDTVASGGGLFRVPFYCIENILCDPSAMHDLLYEEDPISLKSKLIANFHYEHWLKENEDLLFELFVEYAISFTLNPTQQTVAFSVTNLVSSDNGILDKKKVLDRIEHLKNESILNSSNALHEDSRKNILSNFDALCCSKFDVVSGKDYLLPLLKTRMKSIVHTRVPDINLKIRLAMKCDISKLLDSDLHIAL